MSLHVLSLSFLPFSSSVLPQVRCSATSSPPWWDMELSTSTFQTDLRAGGHRSYRALHFKQGGTKVKVLVSKLGEGTTSSVVCFVRQLVGRSGFQELDLSLLPRLSPLRLPLLSGKGLGTRLGGSGFQELENRVNYKVDLTLSM